MTLTSPLAIFSIGCTTHSIYYYLLINLQLDAVCSKASRFPVKLFNTIGTAQSICCSLVIVNYASCTYHQYTHREEQLHSSNASKRELCPVTRGSVRQACHQVSYLVCGRIQRLLFVKLCLGVVRLPVLLDLALHFVRKQRRRKARMWVRVWRHVDGVSAQAWCLG